MSILRRITNLFRRSTLDQDIDVELHSHIEMRVADNIAAGMSPQQARRDALLRFGSRPATKERVIAADAYMFLDSLWRDLVYAFRMLRKSPGFTLVATFTLALGIIGTTLTFTAYDAIALRTLAVRDPASLVVLKQELRKGGTSTKFSDSEYQNFAEHDTVFEGTVAESDYETMLAQLTDMGQGRRLERQQVIIKFVSENYFSLLGVKAIVGRTFADKNAAEPVAILSYSSWQRRFHANPAIVGQSVLVDGTTLTIVGVAQRDFIGTGLPPVPPDFWLPLPMQTRVESGHNGASRQDEARLRVLGRLKPDVSARQAGIALTAIVQRFESSRGLPQVTAAIRTDPPVYLLEKGDPQFDALAALLIVSWMVLLIACANLASFFLARATARRKEMAIRRALGASRMRLMRQMLTEGVLIGLVSGAITLFISPLLCDFVWKEIQNRVIFRFSDLYVFSFQFSADGWVLACTMVASVAAGMLFSVLGAAQCAETDSNEAFQGHVPRWRSIRGRARANARDMLIGVQVVFSAILLVIAGLTARGMTRGQKFFPGFDTGHVIDIEFADTENAGIDRAHREEFREQLAHKLSVLPQVKAVAFADHVPLLGAGTTTINEPGKDRERAFDNQISPGFFSVFGIRIVRGRDFTSADAIRHDSVIITESTARHLWPGQDALGRNVRLGDTQTPAEVVGVAQDTRQVILGRVEPLYLYLPAPAAAPIGDVFVRTTGEDQSSMRVLLTAVAGINTKLASLASVHRMADALWFQRLPSKIAALFASIVGVLGLFLAGVGIYGTIAYVVAQRTREIGIRIALGAQPGTILRLVFLHMIVLVVVAACIGLALAATISHALTALPLGMGSLLLFGVSPWDPLVFTTVPVFLALIALSGAYLPARRAMRVDPMVALRYE